MEKDSFILYKSQIKILKSLEPEERLKFYDAIFDYATDKIDPVLPNAALQALFQIFKHRIDLDESKYQTRCQKNAENINKRWNKENTVVYEPIRPDTKPYEAIPSDSDSDSDSESDSDNESIIKKNFNKKKISNSRPADLSEVITYGQEIGLTEDQSAAFHDHFESNGWKVSGKSPMKDWRAAMRNWKRNARPQSISTASTSSQPISSAAERERPSKKQMLFYALNHAKPLYKVNLSIFAENQERNGWVGDWRQKLEQWFGRVMENESNPARRFLTLVDLGESIAFREFAGAGTGQVQIHDLYGVRLPIRKAELAEFR